MKQCTKCIEFRKDSEFYGKRNVCKYCHKEYVYSKRFYERKLSKSNLSGKKETIKTNPNSISVNYELYNYLLKL
jgi:hypothetical protein